MYSIKEIKAYGKLATKGDREAQQLLFSINNEIAREVNKRLIGLEKTGYDYGIGWATAVNYTQVMYESNRFAYSKNMDNDYYQMSQQSQIGIKFLGSESSTVEGQKAIAERRIRKFREKGILDETVSDRRAKNFLKFLGNEEVSETIESYGHSETVIEMLWDAYQIKDNTKKKMLKALGEYLTVDEKTGRHLKDFKQTMEELQIDISRYSADKKR